MREKEIVIEERKRREGNNRGEGNREEVREKREIALTNTQLQSQRSTYNKHHEFHPCVFERDTFGKLL